MEKLSKYEDFIVWCFRGCTPLWGV